MFAYMNHWPTLVLSILVLTADTLAPAFASKTDEKLLIIGAANGFTEGVELLLKAGNDINEQLSNGATALIMASWKGHHDTVKLLLHRGAAINTKTNEGITALFIASMNGHNEVVYTLLAHRAALNIRSSDDYTALIMASYKGHTRVVKILVARGANTALKYKGETALDLAKNTAIKKTLRKAANPK